MTSVMSSCCGAPAANASAASMILAIISSAHAFLALSAMLLNLISPHSSSERFIASLMPSVKITITSPGATAGHQADDGPAGLIEAANSIGAAAIGNCAAGSRIIVGCFAEEHWRAVARIHVSQVTRA